MTKAGFSRASKATHNPAESHARWTVTTCHACAGGAYSRYAPRPPCAAAPQDAVATADPPIEYAAMELIRKRGGPGGLLFCNVRRRSPSIVGRHRLAEGNRQTVHLIPHLTNTLLNDGYLVRPVRGSPCLGQLAFETIEIHLKPIESFTRRTRRSKHGRHLLLIPSLFLDNPHGWKLLPRREIFRGDAFLTPERGNRRGASRLARICAPPEPQPPARAAAGQSSATSRSPRHSEPPGIFSHA